MLKLQSSDGVIFPVDAATVEQMVTIQTMIDHEDEDSDEVTPVPTVKAKVLEKIIQWTEYHKIDHEQTEKIAWYIHYFNVELNNMFEIIIAADYLEVENLLNESCRNVLINNKWEIIEDAVYRLHEPAEVLTPLKHFERENGYEVVVAIVDKTKLTYFDTKTESWIHLTDIPDSFQGIVKRLCVVEGNIYLVGRWRVTEYNPRTNTWGKMPRLQEEKYCRTVCTVDNKIFVFGGSGLTSSCEMLDLGDDDPHWKYIANTNNVIDDGVAVAIDKKIYVLGGELTDVEEYDVDQDQWNIVNTNMPTKKLWPCVAVLDRKIYVTGGYFKGEIYIPGSSPSGRHIMSRVDCFDPDTNTWSQVASMNIERGGPSLVSLHRRLYAIGGADVDSLEVYDPDNNTWTLLQQKLDGKVSYNGACIIKKYYLHI